ncbi:MAG: hypothetical protein AAGC60_19270 [Acidobacteriota bacterium]
MTQTVANDRSLFFDSFFFIAVSCLLAALASFFATATAAMAAGSPVQVTTTAPSSASECTLADAVDSVLARASLGACVWGGDNAIQLDSDATYRLATPLPTITKSVAIAGDFSLSRPARIEWASGASGRFFQVQAPARLSLSTVALAGGSASVGGAIYVGTGAELRLTGVDLESNTASVYGGAVFNQGAVAMSNSTIEGNEAGFHGGAFFNAGAGTLAIQRSLLVANRAAYGAAIAQAGDAITLDGSTVSGNHASSHGGAFFVNDGPVTIDWSTFKDNRADGLGSTFFVTSRGSVTIGRSAVTADPALGGLCHSSTNMTSAGDNAWSDASCGPPPAEVVGAEIALSELVDHGGLTRVHVPLCDWTTGICASPLFDRFACCALGECANGVQPARDQRDQFPRRDVIGGTTAASGGSACDIGAYESVCESYSLVSNGPGETVAVLFHETQIVTEERPVLLDNGSCKTHPLFDPSGSGCRISWSVYGAKLAVRDVVFIESACSFDCFHAPEDCLLNCALPDPVGWIPDPNLARETFAFDVPACNLPTESGRYLAILEDTTAPGPTWPVDPQTPIDVDSDD